jgi:hypothetical protein
VADAAPAPVTSIPAANVIATTVPAMNRLMLSPPDIDVDRTGLNLARRAPLVKHPGVQLREVGRHAASRTTSTE